MPVLAPNNGVIMDAVYFRDFFFDFHVGLKSAVRHEAKRMTWKLQTFCRWFKSQALKPLISK